MFDVDPPNAGVSLVEVSFSGLAERGFVMAVVDQDE
jgi:hypothetical protein